MSNRTLRDATVQELIGELTRKESITIHRVAENDVATIKTTNSLISVLGEAYVLVIGAKSELTFDEAGIRFKKKEEKAEDSSTPNSMPYKEITDWSIFFK